MVLLSKLVNNFSDLVETMNLISRTAIIKHKEIHLNPESILQVLDLKWGQPKIFRSYSIVDKHCLVLNHASNLSFMTIVSLKIEV